MFYSIDIEDLNYRNNNQFLNDILVYVKDKLNQNVKIISEIEFYTDNDGIIKKILINNDRLKYNNIFNLNFVT